MKKTVHYLILIILVSGIALNVNAQSKVITVEYKKNDDNSYDFYYKKQKHGSYEISVKFTNLQNSLPSDYKGVVSGSYGKLFKLRPMNDKRSISFSYSYSYRRGSPNPKADNEIVYTLPFGKGKTVHVNEMTNLGEQFFEKAPPKNWKAYQFTLSSPDTVHAVRKGIVIEVTDLYEADTLNSYTYSRKTNKIIIEHPDGTLASYSGFMKSKILVKEGQTVYPQTSLGILGRYDNRKTYYRLAFMAYFLSDSSMGKKSKKNSSASGSSYEFITPYFYTSEGKLILAPKKEYTVDFNDDILTQELTRREKKNFQKKKKSRKGN